MNNEFPKFRITYQNGMTQVKNLIDKYLYSDIKEMNRHIISLEAKQVGFGKKSKEFKTIEQEINAIEEKIAEFGEYFVEGSPLHKAIFNGGNLILPYSQGGVQKINVELINK